jgi:hypothetical protein
MAKPSAVEVTNVSGGGFWLLIDDRELFLSTRSAACFGCWKEHVGMVTPSLSAGVGQ